MSANNRNIEKKSTEKRTRLIEMKFKRRKQISKSFKLLQDSVQSIQVDEDVSDDDYQEEILTETLSHIKYKEPENVSNKQSSNDMSIDALMKELKISLSHTKMLAMFKVIDDYFSAKSSEEVIEVKDVSSDDKDGKLQ
ncbi:Hypothetical protein CINCED_3A025148 [Cinara cedri]|uniref:Uncharacterized protein n=1 Tax=Cinara cedri TaxID=506608 RepID=A0A5E4N0N1_9HEMI|nr:Hypothetical protein CINCED_3A025148 [Cinara cedri]